MLRHLQCFTLVRFHVSSHTICEGGLQERKYIPCALTKIQHLSETFQVV